MTPRITARRIATGLLTAAVLGILVGSLGQIPGRTRAWSQLSKSRVPIYRPSGSARHGHCRTYVAGRLADDRRLAVSPSSRCREWLFLDWCCRHCLLTAFHLPPASNSIIYCRRQLKVQQDRLLRACTTMTTTTARTRVNWTPAGVVAAYRVSRVLRSPSPQFRR